MSSLSYYFYLYLLIFMFLKAISVFVYYLINYYSNLHVFKNKCWYFCNWYFCNRTHILQWSMFCAIMLVVSWCSFDKYLSEIIAWGWFHFSIGRVNSELYALGSGTWNLESINVGNRQTQLNMQSWMRDYVNVLCINSWQVLI